MTESLVNRLKERGSKAERYYLKPTYRLSIDGDTINNGKMVSKIDKYLWIKYGKYYNRNN